MLLAQLLLFTFFYLRSEGLPSESSLEQGLYREYNFPSLFYWNCCPFSALPFFCFGSFEIALLRHHALSLSLSVNCGGLTGYLLNLVLLFRPQCLHSLLWRHQLGLLASVIISGFLWETDAFQFSKSLISKAPAITESL